MAATVVEGAAGVAAAKRSAPWFPLAKLPFAPPATVVGVVMVGAGAAVLASETEVLVWIWGCGAAAVLSVVVSGR